MDEEFICSGVLADRPRADYALKYIFAQKHLILGGYDNLIQSQRINYLVRCIRESFLGKVENSRETIVPFGITGTLMMPTIP